MAPAVPPIPTSEPTARRGKTSEGSVNRLQENPWCAAVGKRHDGDGAPQAVDIRGCEDGHHQHRTEQHRPFARGIERESGAQQP